MSCVWVTRTRDTAGIWTMATAPEHQRQGAGEALLSRVMADYAADGVQVFYLGATPEGLPLYERWGFRRIGIGEVWIAANDSAG